jgi:TolA-binding protein
LALRAVAEEVLSDPALQTARADTSLKAPAVPQAGTAPVMAAADSIAAADSVATAADSVAVAAGSAASPTAPAQTEPEPQALTAEQETRLAGARAQIDEVWSRLQSMRKLAAKQGKQTEHDIEVAVTRALRGDAPNAIEDLDQIARLKPKTPISARARFEIGEIHRRAYDLDAARQAYDEAGREASGIPIVELARKKSAAIGARKAAQERLADAATVLERWHAAGGLARAGVGTDRATGADSLPQLAGAAADSGAAASPDDLLKVAADFEALAAEQLRVAEIDLLDLDQPLVALREFERLLARYPGSLQAPRAAFAIAWIYDYRLRDPARAREAYRSVVESFPESAQGRAAEEILAHWNEPGREVQDPFSRP